MYPPKPHDPAALAYLQLFQQQQPAPQYTPSPAFPFALPAGAPQPLAPQYMPPPPQYTSPPPSFQPSALPAASPRRPRQSRQQQPEPHRNNEFVSLSVVLLSLLIGAALGAVAEHHRHSATVAAGVVP